VEGMNIGAMLLGFLGVLVSGLTSLVALGLLIARQIKPALITFAAGLLVTAVIAALSFLQHGGGYDPDPDDLGARLMIVLSAVTLLLAGAGQFISALQGPRPYAAAFGCAAGSMVFVAAPLLGEVSLLGDSLLAVSLLLALLSLMIAVLPPRRRTLLLWTALAALGGIAGFGVGDACVTTRSTLLDGFPGGKEDFRGRVRVEMHVLGVRVSDETGFALIPRVFGKDWQVNPGSSVRAASLTQAAWLYGPPAAGAIAGIVAGLILSLRIARLLVRQSGEGVHAEPLAEADRPREHGPSSDSIKPA
jgi:hypothetical protein